MILDSVHLAVNLAEIMNKLCNVTISALTVSRRSWTALMKDCQVRHFSLEKVIETPTAVLTRHFWNSNRHSDASYNRQIDCPYIIHESVFWWSLCCWHLIFLNWIFKGFQGAQLGDSLFLCQALRSPPVTLFWSCVPHCSDSHSIATGSIQRRHNVLHCSWLLCDGVAAADIAMLSAVCLG